LGNFRETTIDDLRKAKIFVATPCYGGMTSGTYTKSVGDFSSFFTKYGIEYKFFFIFNESLVQRARNYCVDEFLRSDCTHLLFIDADIGFSPEDVVNLMAVQISDPEKYSVVAATYPKKTICWDKVITMVNNDTENKLTPKDVAAIGASDKVFNLLPNVQSYAINEPLEVSETGTGFMMIPRETFTKYKTDYPQYSYLPDHIKTKNFGGDHEIMAFFDCSIDPESKRYLSEDYHFCHNVRKIGMKVWVLPWINLSHFGSIVYGGTNYLEKGNENETK
jgi:hypothetical protein